MDPKMSSEEAALVAQKVGGSVNLRWSEGQHCCRDNESSPCCFSFFI